jgi:hypothetical protein
MNFAENQDIPTSGKIFCLYYQENNYLVGKNRNKETSTEKW